MGRSARRSLALAGAAALALPFAVLTAGAAGATDTASYDTSTLAGKAASVHGTDGLQIRFSAFLEEEGEDDPDAVLAADGAQLAADAPTSVQAPDVTVNADRNGAPQNETAIAVDPNNPNVVVGSANDYVTLTWGCTYAGGPCSRLGDAYSGTYLSTDGGRTWGENSTDPDHLGTLIPGVTHLAGGTYDGGGDPVVAFDSRGHVFYGGLGFDRNDAASGVEVSTGTISGGHLSWSQPTWVTQTNDPAIFNDKEWIDVDHNPASPYRDRVYVSYTRFLYGANGAYVGSPIYFASSSDGGRSFTPATPISDTVKFDQGSRPVVAPDGTVYVFFEGATRFDALDGTWFVKSTDGGKTFSKPSLVATLQDIGVAKDTAFRVNSFPAAAAGPDGSLYATWSSSMKDGTSAYTEANFCAYEDEEPAGCHAQSVWTVSRDGGATWSTPVAIPGTTGNRTAVGYPVKQQGKVVLAAPAAAPADSMFSSVAVSPRGKVVLSSYVGNVVSPWPSCAQYDPSGSFHCLQPGPYVNNEKMNYVVSDPAGTHTANANVAPINTRYNFRGGFFGDYTDIAIGADDVAHPLWTDSNNTQTVTWWAGTRFDGLPANQQDAVTVRLAF